jgi:hypothetical protein
MTTNTITDDQIAQLRTEAYDAVDTELAVLCEIALGDIQEDSNGRRVLPVGLMRHMSANAIGRLERIEQEEARALCVEAISAARAQAEGESGIVRVVVDYETNPEDWWDAARASRAEAPKAVLPLLDADDEITVPRSTADAIVAWAATLPGWDTGVAHAPHPLYVDEAE